MCIRDRYYEVRVGHSIDEKLYELVFGRDENLALNMIDIFHQALRLRSVLPDKMNVEQIFNFFKENRDRIFRLLGKKIPFIIIDNFNLLADKDGKNLKSIYDSVKHSRDEKYLNLILVSNEGALPLLDLERGTNARVDNLLHMPELSNDEISNYISCCFRKYNERTGRRIEPEVQSDILPRLANEIGGNILYLQNFCTESIRNQENKNLTHILQELIVRRRRDFQFLGVYLGELSFSENKMSSKQFLQLLQIFQALIDEGPLPRQELILRTGRQLSIDIFRKNIIRLFFNGEFRSIISHILETTHEFYVNFQTKLHRRFAEMMLGTANSTRRIEVIGQLKKLYNFELNTTIVENVSR
eukprot:TRINITY_DN8673_c0_g1_i4.p1 TRINITY_DN8673_c0_g1~~TRINITY_DN8673_c0_g1_i4.p1  ORF type:complete len:357 (+),score=73.44 TRINITY_DN8673_c0_g1_i4:64-1134(+)